MPPLPVVVALPSLSSLTGLPRAASLLFLASVLWAVSATATATATAQEPERSSARYVADIQLQDAQQLNELL